MCKHHHGDFNFCPNCGIELGSFKKKNISTDCVDVDGNEYKTKMVGDTLWMAEDLRVANFNDGSTIKVVECPDCWSNLKTPAMCYYDNDKTKTTLYNFYAVKTGKLAPKGWHVATDKEWSFITKTEQIDLLPGGYRSSNRAFGNVGSGGYWWSATAYDATYAWYRYMYYDYANVDRYYYSYTYGFSVRCVKD
jgi:hypothetical protein